MNREDRFRETMQGVHRGADAERARAEELRTSSAHHAEEAQRIGVGMRELIVERDGDALYRAVSGHDEHASEADMSTTWAPNARPTLHLPKVYLLRAPRERWAVKHLAARDVVWLNVSVLDIADTEQEDVWAVIIEVAVAVAWTLSLRPEAPEEHLLMTAVGVTKRPVVVL